jgi:hypothetical protein
MFFSKRKTIEFRARHPELDIAEPKPASSVIPSWYKITPQVNEKILTAKKCVPMLDALSAGYVITLPVDIYWDEEKERKYWYDSKVELISQHHPVQTNKFDTGEEYESQPYKWDNNYHVKTPKGYSTLFVHPINRLDLPFYSFTGFVDTDKHPLITNFPFLIKKGFRGIIPKGTPIIQAIPIKREDWTGEVKDTNKPYEYVKEYEVFTPPFGWYKRNWWTKKRYQ